MPRAGELDGAGAGGDLRVVIVELGAADHRGRPGGDEEEVVDQVASGIVRSSGDVIGRDDPCGECSTFRGSAT